MDVEFKTSDCSCLKVCLREVQNAEETLEIRLSDGLPDIGRVLAAWGQPILRGKEWRRDRISVSAGMMVWVLYSPEDGSTPRCLEGWSPFQLRWDLPEDCGQGKLRVSLKPRFADARTVSARKIMVRLGLGAQVEALCPVTVPIPQAEETKQPLELLPRSYPVLLRQEAGEQTFQLQEDLTVPAGQPQPQKLLYACLDPEITEQRITSNRVVFRGNGNLHIAYLDQEDKVSSCDFPLSFSQLGDLDRSYPDAQVDTVLAVTNLEPELEEGILHLKSGMVAQFLVKEPQQIQVATDAYCPGRNSRIQQNYLEIPVLLDTREEKYPVAVSVPGAGIRPVDMLISGEHPSASSVADGARMLLGGTCQILYYDEDGALQARQAPWEVEEHIHAGENVNISLAPGRISDPQQIMTGDGMELSLEYPVTVCGEGDTQIPAVAGVDMGEPKPEAPNRPSLVLCRAGEEGLWNLAKRTDSTMEAIQKANGLSQEPEPGQLLLIPMGMSAAQ